MPNKNAEHIKHLKEMADRIGNSHYRVSLHAGVVALRNEGRSPWRKVTKRHPGKKWELTRIISIDTAGRPFCVYLPFASDWDAWKSKFHFLSIWHPWPEHPEKGKVR